MTITSNLTHPQKWALVGALIADDERIMVGTFYNRILPSTLQVLADQGHVTLIGTECAQITDAGRRFAERELVDMISLAREDKRKADLVAARDEVTEEELDELSVRGPAGDPYSAAERHVYLNDVLLGVLIRVGTEEQPSYGDVLYTAKPIGAGYHLTLTYNDAKAHLLVSWREHTPGEVRGCTEFSGMPQHEGKPCGCALDAHGVCPAARWHFDEMGRRERDEALSQAWEALQRAIQGNVRAEALKDKGVKDLINATSMQLSATIAAVAKLDPQRHA